MATKDNFSFGDKGKFRKKHQSQELAIKNCGLAYFKRNLKIKKKHIFAQFSVCFKNRQKLQNGSRSPYHEHQLTRETAGDQSAVIIIQFL